MDVRLGVQLVGLDHGLVGMDLRLAVFVQEGHAVVKLHRQIAGVVGPAVGQGQRSLQAADGHHVVQLHHLAGGGGDRVLPEGGGGGVQGGAAELIDGRRGQLLHPVDAHVAAGFSRGGDHVLVGALGDRFHRLVKEAGGHQVVAGPVRGVLREEGGHLVNHAPVGLLFPLGLRALLGQARDLVFVRGYRVFDHALRIQAAGQAREDISVSIDTLAAAYAADCHMKQLLSEIQAPPGPPGQGCPAENFFNIPLCFFIDI